MGGWRGKCGYAGGHSEQKGIAYSSKEAGWVNLGEDEKTKLTTSDPIGTIVG